MGIRGILFDLDGVLYVGGASVPGALEVLTWARDQGIPHLFVTNTSSRPRQAVVEKLAGLGITVEPERLLTPAVAAAQWLGEQPAGPLALFVPEATEAELAEFPRLPSEAEKGAAAVVVGDLGPSWDFARLNRAFRLLMDQPAPSLVALGMTRYWRAEDGLRLDTGAFVQALAYATGATPVVTGKPAPAFFQAAARELQLDAASLVMVGDDIRGDIHGAQQAGLKGLLVRTGKFSPRDLELDVAPDGVLDSVAELPSWWARQAH
jgi:HAD superfamily hydrolase (TIGR01458 family)